MADINTKRDFLVAVIEDTDNEDIKAFAENEIAKLDATNAKRREKQAEKNDEKDAMAKVIAETYLNAETALTATAVKDAMVADEYKREDEKDVNVQFVSAMLRKAVANGIATAEDVKITGKGVQKAYKLA